MPIISGDGNNPGQKDYGGGKIVGAAPKPAAPAPKKKAAPSVPNIPVSGFSKTQLANARIIISVGKSMGMSNRDIQIGLMTAMQESSLLNYGSTVYPETRGMGAQAMGSDHDSVGLFQQRPQSGWGEPSELMDQATATKKFFSALKKVGNRGSISLGAAAQAVQRSAHPGRYATHAAGAAKLMQKLAGVSAGEAKKYVAEAGSAGAGGGGVDAEDTWSKSDFKAALAASGFGSYLINSSKELKDLFAKAISGEWSPERFAGEVRSTKWYRQRSASQRDYDTKRKNDPGTWSRELSDKKNEILSIANQMGIKLSGGRLDALAKSAYRNGITTDTGELGRLVAAEFDYDPKKSYSAGAGEALTTVRNTAADYGVTLSNQAVGSMAEKILRGEQTKEGLANVYKDMAKRNYAHFAKELDSGLTLNEIADPYRQVLAKTLELNPNDINIYDKTLQQGLLQKDAKTGATSAMTLWQYEDSLRKDARWLRTDNAQESLLSAGRKVLADFGLVV